MILAGGPGRYYLNYIGAFVRFLGFWIWNGLTSRRFIEFKVFLKGSIKENTDLEEDEYYPKNIYWGILTLVVLIMFVVSLDL